MSKGHLIWYHNTLHSLLSKEEIEVLLKKSNLRGILEVSGTWFWILLAFLLVGFFPNFLTIVISLFIIGGKQLACAIIMHDASHDSIFESRFLNKFVGNWLGAYPIFHRLELYKPYHLNHHIFTGLDEDPDLALTTGYPAGRNSMLRKFARDLFFVTGIKGIIGILLMISGFYKYELNGKITKKNRKGIPIKKKILEAIKGLHGPIILNLIIFGLCFISFGYQLYFLWPLALVTTYPFCLRVRSMAEHSMLTNRHNPRENTRSLEANFMERLLFAPHNVNFHAEHHLCMGVPPYNLPKFHKLLLKRNYFTTENYSRNYWEIIRKSFMKDVVV